MFLNSLKHCTEFFEGVRSGEITVIHQSGALDHDRVEELYRELGLYNLKNVKVLNFIEDMAERYANSSLVISRAGATTISELIELGLPSILVPLVSKDKHQEKNALEMRDTGASLCFLQNETDPREFGATLVDLLNNPDSLDRFSAAASKMRPPKEPAKAIVAKLLKS